MADVLSIRVTGFKELETALRKLPHVVAGKTLRSGLRTAAAPMVADARAAAPRSDIPRPRRRWGNLNPVHMADSIALRTFRGEGLNDLEVHLWFGPGVNHFYGMFQEFGTRHLGALPFLRPAWDRGVPTVLDRFGRALWAAIARAARRQKRGP